jgi:hypothetical protein
VKARIQQIARQAFATLGAIRQSATYTHIVSSAYDPTTSGTTTLTNAFAVSVVLTDYSRYERNASQGKIDVKDRKALVLPSDMNDIDPTFGDTITLSNGDTYRIVDNGIGLDPAEALYVLQVREINRGGEGY